MLFNKNCCGFGGMRNNNMGMCPRQPQTCEREIVEPTITNCVEKEFYHEVPHVCFFMIEKKNSLYKNILFIMKLIY